ncbi:MAG: AAC(3) family N-acetyltransferase [Planctomycetes bacterium]|nr:AAC(3) family N-acetyltransferase [Planctomycetota bacterium]
MDREAVDCLQRTLASVLGPTPGMAVIHSSLIHLAPPSGLGREGVLAALAALVADGWTLAFPAFTFSFCRGVPFHLAASPSESGVLADWALTGLPGARRSRHPVYSFVAVGPSAEAILAAPAVTTSFGDDTPFAVFEAHDAVQVALGCGLNFFTQCHRYEQLASVPYRNFKTFTGQADWDDGRGFQTVSCRNFARDLQLGHRSDWAPLFARIRAAGGLTERTLWADSVYAASTAASRAAALALLWADPL